MSRKKLLTASILSLFLPIVTLAASNTTTLTTVAKLNVSGLNIGVDAANSVLESIQVNPTNFVATLSPGSTLYVTSADKATFTTSQTGQGVNINIICQPTYSGISVNYPTNFGVGGGGLNVVTVSVSTTVCGGSTNNGAIVSGGGGGGGSSSSSVNTTVAGQASASSQSTATVPAPSQKVSVGTVAGHIQSSTSPMVPAITRSFVVGQKSNQVKILQQILNVDGETVTLSGPGSPGHETNKFGPATVRAIKKFQVKYGLSRPGKAGYGTLNFATRAKLNALARGLNISLETSVTPTRTFQATKLHTSIKASSSQQAKLKQLNSLLMMIQQLQAQLKAQQGR